MNTTNVSAQAADKFLAGYNCAQAVLHAFCEPLQLDKNTALKLACGFGSGMAREQSVCGAVTGGIMALGLKFGRGEGEEKTKTEAVYGRTQEFMTRFKAEFGSLNCRDLTGCDLKTPEGQAFFKQNELARKTCAKCVGKAAELVEAAMNS